MSSTPVSGHGIAQTAEAAGYVSWQAERFREAASWPAIIWRDRTYTYADVLDWYGRWLEDFRGNGVESGASVAVVGDYSPASITCLLALIALRCILVPLSLDSRDQHREFFRIAEIDCRVEIDPEDQTGISPASERRDHPLLAQLRAAGEPGLILFSSGSTGKPKAILHSLARLLQKFREPRRRFRTISFLLFDHIGGVNTLFYTLANLGTVIIPTNRSVQKVCEAIQDHRAELLPTSPSFLNLLLLSDAHRNYDLSSLKLITYGTEVMPERTLQMAVQAFPNATFQQTYGLSELGILRSKSESNESLFVKIGGEDFETKVVDGTLRIRAKSSMLGYLNALSPFDSEGWFDTGDAAIHEGDYYRILGRNSEVINVGGQKVFPAEVEKVIAELSGVLDVTVRGEPHLLLGQVVEAIVQMEEPVPAIEMKKRITEHCKGRLQPFMVPAKVRVVRDSQVNYRFKKVRR
jgi:long-chain acyl-CoA synthetase